MSGNRRLIPTTEMVKRVAQAIADERVRQFGPIAGVVPRTVEYDYARAAIAEIESTHVIMEVVK